LPDQVENNSQAHNIYVPERRWIQTECIYDPLLCKYRAKS